MTKDEYEDFALRYKGCGACFPMYHTLSRFEKMWFSAIQKDVAELEKENKVLAQNLEDTEIINKTYEKRFNDLEKENAELRKVAEFQQSSNMNRHFENKKLKEGLAVGSTLNKALNSMNKNLEEERDKYRNMVFDKDDQLTNAKEIIKKLKALYFSPVVTNDDVKRQNEIFAETEQFLNSEVENFVK